jgi:hypothetical protein
MRDAPSVPPITAYLTAACYPMMSDARAATDFHQRMNAGLMKGA